MASRRRRVVSIPDPSDSDDDPPGGRIPPTIVASDSDEEPLATRRSRQKSQRLASTSRTPVDTNAGSRRGSTPRSVRFADDDDDDDTSPGRNTRAQKKRGRAVIEDGDGDGTNDENGSGQIRSSSRRPQRASAAAAHAAMSGRKLNLQRGLRDDPDYDDDDEEDGDDHTLEPARWEKERNKNNRSQRSPAKPRGRNVARRKSSSKLPVPEYTPCFQGGPGVDPRFYEYRPKVKVAGVNAERVSDEEEFSSDMEDFVCDDDDVEEEGGGDGDDVEEEDGGGGDGAGKTSDDAIEIQDDDDDCDKNKNSSASASKEASSSDDVDPPSPVAVHPIVVAEPTSARSRRLRERKERKSRGQGGAEEEGDENESDEEAPDSPGKEKGGASPAPRRRVRPGHNPRAILESSDDEDIPPMESPAVVKSKTPTSESAERGEKRTSSRISVGRARKSEIWKEHVSELKEKMGREEAELREIERADDDAEIERGDDEDDDDGVDFIVFDEENVAFFEEEEEEDDEDRPGSEAEPHPGEIDGVKRAPGLTEATFEWVHCECGCVEDDGRDDMIRCCNARCGVWQHSGCVDHIPDSTFFCASCAEQGGYGADPPPHKPVRLGATRSTHGDRAFVGITKPRNQTAWSNDMAKALAGDDVKTVDELLKQHPQPPSRGAMLSRAAVAGAAECVRGLIGKTPNIGVPVATKKEIGRAMHKALAAGHRKVVEAVRSALGTKLFIDTPNSNQHEHWPLGPGGYTLAHSAAANAKGDPGCVWLALEAMGEPPSPGDELDAFQAAAAASAIPPPPPAALHRRAMKGQTKATAGSNDVDTGVDVVDIDDEDEEDTQPAEVQAKVGDEINPFTPSAATTAPLLIGPAWIAHGLFYSDRPAAAVSDEAAVTPIMLAAGAGGGWEGCVSALLWSAKSRRTRGMTENFDVAAAISLTDEESQSTAAHYAAQSGAYATLRLLATYHAPIVKKGNYNGETPLHHAAANGQEECIRVLTDELGCERTVSDKSGWIPLLYADYAHRRGAVLTLMAEDLQTQLGAMHDILDSRVSRSKVMKVLRMIATVPPFYDALNAHIRAHVALLSGPLAFLLRHNTSNVVDFANRRSWLADRLHEKHRYSASQSTHSADFEQLAVTHSNTWEHLRAWVLRNGHTHLTAAPLGDHCSFRGMPARGPGVERDILDRVAVQITRDGEIDKDDVQSLEPDEGVNALTDLPGSLNPHIALLRPSFEGLDVYHPPNLPNPLPPFVEEGYGALGWILGYCVLHQSPFPVSFSSAFLKGILGKPAGWEDLEEMAPEVARSMGIVRDMESGVENLCLSFSVEEEETIVPGHGEFSEFDEDEDESEEDPTDPYAKATRSLTRNPSDVPMMTRITHWVRQMEHSNETMWRSGSMHADRARAMLESEFRVDLSERTTWVSRAVEVAVAKTLGLPLKPDTKARSVVDLTGEEGLSKGSIRQRRVETELVPGGSKKTVTDSNKDEYVKLHARHKLDRVTKSPALEAIRNGLYEIVPLELLKHFTAPEFACLLGGVAAIDVGDWRRHARYDGYDVTSPQVRWLWRLITRFTPDERTLLLKFSTGSSRMPVGGFGQLQGMGGAHPFTVVKTPLTRGAGSGRTGAYCLPTSATCFNTLRLPEYPTYEALEEAVTIALRHGVAGFAFG